MDNVMAIVYLDLRRPRMIEVQGYIEKEYPDALITVGQGLLYVKIPHITEQEARAFFTRMAKQDPVKIQSYSLWTVADEAFKGVYKRKQKREKRNKKAVRLREILKDSFKNFTLHDTKTGARITPDTPVIISNNNQTIILKTKGGAK